MPRKIKLNTYLEEYSNIDQLDPENRELLLKARAVCASAYAPYSRFQVGAAVLLENGRIVLGTNQENAAYPSGLCAERVALFAASSEFPKIAARKIAISARKKGKRLPVEVTPCGGCRQVMIEYQNLQDESLEIIMEGPQGKIYRAHSVDVLLPFKFSLDNQ